MKIDRSGNVLSIDGLSETKLAGLAARYSRTVDSIEKLVEDSRFSEEDDLGSQKMLVSMMDRGHRPIMQLGSVHLFFEKISMLAAMTVTDGRYGAYVESSTRFIRFSEPEFSPYGENQDFQRELIEVYNKTYPVLEKKLGSAKKARDVCRGLIPLGCLTNVAFHGNFQAAQDLAIRLLSSELTECNDLGASVLEMLGRQFGHVFGESEVKFIGDVVGYRVDLRNKISINMRNAAHSEGEVELIDFYPKEAELELGIAVLQETSKLSYEEVSQFVRQSCTHSLSDLLEEYGKGRILKEENCSRALERIHYLFQWKVDVGTFRDLHRHRALSMIYTYADPRYGFDYPHIDDVVFDAWNEAIDKVKDLYFSSHSKVWDKQYFLPLSTKLVATVDVNARELMHMVEQRTQKEGHPTYRRICQHMHSLVGKNTGMIGYLMKHVDYKDY